MQVRKNFKLFIFIIVFIFIILFTIPIFSRSYLERLYFQPQEIISQKIEQGIIDSNHYEIIFTNLEVPWSIVFLNNREILITERKGNIKIIDTKNKKLIQDFKIAGVRVIGEGGLLGSALHPNFEKNNFIYFYYTTKRNKNVVNRVERYKLIKNNIKGDFKKYKLIKDKIIIDNIPGSNIHNGGRIKFGPDDYLYITTGDAGNSQNSQEINSLAGKILRIKDDGSIPLNNPFKNLTYAYGIRNSQGITWDNQNNLWSIDHGRSGIKSGLDEINLIKKGKNYGWPIIQGDEKKEGLESPNVHSGSDITWAPADLIFYQGNLFFTGLRGEGLYQYNIKDKKISVHFFKKFGRLRAITLGPDGNFYLSTSNRDGRGYPRENDDKIIKIDPSIILKEDISRLIQVELPKENTVIKSPLIIKGKAKGIWFFEGNFPVILTDKKGNIVSQGYVSAKDNWMTENFVPFEGKIEFKNNINIDGYLIFKNSNPSGLPENDFYFKIPIKFK
ncbi:MAG: PQQ-dependent sugar dehydrogenase [Patescibacteria group bacterium]|nr:PQQ-dependent sugar dehydrogenase [Patescibacteria group bacterium]